MSDTGIDAATLTNAVQLAARAPSLHNTQPWRLIAEDGEVRLFLDTSRVVRATDRSSREAVISCGVLLDHLRVALAAAGWDTSVERFPNPNDRDHLATLSFRPLGFVTEGHRKRGDAILARRTDRLPMAAYVDWDSFETLLRARLAGGPVHIDVLSEQMRDEVADAAALTESLRLYDSSYHAELAWWTTPFATEDGIPQTALISAEESERVAVARDFPVSPHSRRRPALNNDEATIVVLSTDGYSREDALDAGEALSAVLLECTMAGLTTCPVTHVTELHASRDIIGRLIVRDACPQVLVRIGLAPALDEVPPPTPRRPVEAILTFV
ncbi:Acg family FMN-binding oxidoreductase [Mycolicibacterium goodii]|uniref:NAD(P)H nitroreductase n=1 Tax=Mycolicibacterium goodii TaxID=134601 RepID=A0A0K0X613_MYCGD|nr:NAD(P)H nitroreductase [Mycolicibacterium goodii]